MQANTLLEVYSSLGIKAESVFVVPKIRFNAPKTDYLYLLYNPLLQSSEIDIESTTAFKHYQFVLKAVTSKNVVLHYHWLEFQDLKALTGMPWKLLCIWLFTLFGGKLVWTVHNLEPHNRKWVKLHNFLHKWMANIADKICVHCPSVAPIVQNKYQVDGNKLTWVNHPSFPADFKSKEISLAYLEKKFGITIRDDKPLLLFFGNISLYKGLEEVLNVISSADIDIDILIAGPIKKGESTLAERLNRRTETNPNLHLLYRFIEEPWIPYIFGAADICMFNFSSILTSGSVEMAKSYHKTIIAPKMGCLVELESDSNVYLFDQDSDKAKVLKEVINKFNYD